MTEWDQGFIWGFALALCFAGMCIGLAVGLRPRKRHRSMPLTKDEAEAVRRILRWETRQFDAATHASPTVTYRFDKDAMQHTETDNDD